MCSLWMFTGTNGQCIFTSKLLILERLFFITPLLNTPAHATEAKVCHMSGRVKKEKMKRSENNKRHN